ncbi:general odorant-binding protein 66 [Wyeomyia smithii]|uniref:general odorant-binding protein 66 n=1 Tax=Wyeomyia smithii TaxID=174621 RepID=UPI002467B5C5|nr:general odorant-binding protein 66 [Wyeomyia smithii]
MSTKIKLLVAILYSFLIQQVTMDDDECINATASVNEIKACCDIPNPIEMEHIGGCLEKYKNLDDDKPSMIACVYQCHAMELNVVDESGVDKDKLLEVVNQIVESEVKAVVLSAIDPCIESAQPQANAEVQSQFKCSPLALLLNECIVREVYAHCPEKHWSDAEICSKIRSQDVKICE